MSKNTRAEILAKYIIKNKSTIRQAATHFNMAKSTVHLDVSKRLISENYNLYRKVKKILEINWEQKHIRGGMATKTNWEKFKHRHQYVC